MALPELPAASLAGTFSGETAPGVRGDPEERKVPTRGERKPVKEAQRGEELSASPRLTLPDNPTTRFLRNSTKEGPFPTR